MKLKNFIYYGGAKRALARYYPSPRYDVLVEPFAGGAGYSLEYPERQVILCDMDQSLTDMWLWLISCPEEEMMALPDLPLGAKLSDIDLRPEARTLVGLRIWQGGTTPASSPSRKFNPEFEQFWGPKTKRVLASQLRFIRHWRVVHGHYSQLPRPHATWFVDPPYQGPGRSMYRYWQVDSTGPGDSV